MIRSTTLNEYDVYFTALLAELEELVHSICFSYFAFFAVLLVTISMTRYLLRPFSYYSPAAKKDGKQVFTEKDIS